MKNIDYNLIKKIKWGLGIGDWGLGIGDWAQSPIPNPHPQIIIKIIKNKLKISNKISNLYNK